MIYTPITKKAMIVAYNAHHGQTDPSGVPYIFHPLYLAQQMTDEISTAAALLHDVVEDTPISLDDLRREGFPESVIQVVDLLTHREDVSYLDYVRALKDNPAAKAIKLADLAHNCNVTRLNEVTAEDIKYLARYRAAFEILQNSET